MTTSGVLSSVLPGVATRGPRRNRRGFTLVEMTLAIAITGILLLGMAGALRMSLTAADIGADSLSSVLSTSERLNVISAELSTATQIVTFTANDILMWVPDRNGDGSPESIEYTWSGVAGAAIMRSYNASTPRPYILDVRTCMVSLVSRPAAVPVESAERVLAFFDGGSGGGVTTENKVDDKNSVAQYVRVALPSDATAYKITKAKLYLKKAAGASKLVAVTVQSATAAMKPSGTVLGSAAFAANSAPTNGGWMEFVLAPTGRGLTLAPGQGVCMVIQDGTGGDCKAFSIAGNSGRPFNTHFMSAPESGVWTNPDDAEDLRFYLSGTVTTLSEP